MIELFYFLSPDELTKQLKSNSSINQDDLNKFLKNTKIDNEINNFVDEKEIVFK